MQIKTIVSINHSRRVPVIQFAAVLSILLVTLTGFQGQKPVEAQSASPEAAFPSITLQPYASGLSAPTAIVSPMDNTGRLFVAEQAGSIRIIQDGTITGTFLDISDRVSVSFERGLLGLAFPPNYASKNWFYVYYTNLDGDIVISRFYLTGDNPNRASESSENPILVIEHSQHPNHNGGMIAFGPDRYLYIGVGDGGGGGDPLGSGQRLDTLLGKILRIDVEGAARGLQSYVPAPVKPLTFHLAPQQSHTIYLPVIFKSILPPLGYYIPLDNPFASTPGARPEIWAYGLRNPWRFSFDRLTGDLFIADVGQEVYEEIDHQTAGSGGQNYGWNIFEGPFCYNAPTCSPAGMTMPVAYYAHSTPGNHDDIGCSVTGGYVYRGSSYPSMQGFYFFSDYCTGRIWGLIHEGTWQMQELKGTGGNFATMGESQEGDIYIADINTGVIYRIVQQ